MQHDSDESKALVTRPVDGIVVGYIPRPQEVTCIACKQPVKEGVINYVYAGYDWQKMRTAMKPCLTCSREAVEQARTRRESEQAIRIFGGANIPWRMRMWDFASYPIDADQQAKEQVQDFVARHLAGDQTSKRMLYLAGPTGRCKTSLAVSALKEALQAGKSGLYIMTVELMMRLQSCFHKDTGIHEDELIGAICSTEWLVLDDLAVEKPSTYALKSLYLVIQKRADRGLYTIFTSNLKPSDLERAWRPAGVGEHQFHDGVRVTERLREYAEGCPVQGRNQRS